MIAYKLFRRRKDGTLGPLFINRTQRVPLDLWLQAQSHPTKGFAVRPGWHCSHLPYAPHLAQKDDRVWCEVEIAGWSRFDRPWNQGGLWFIADAMRVVRQLTGHDVNMALRNGR